MGLNEDVYMGGALVPFVPNIFIFRFYKIPKTK